MKKILIIFVLAILISITSYGQVKNTSTTDPIHLIDNKLLIGEWHSESDVQYILVFEKEKFIELYGKDTTDNMYYKLSSTCNLQSSTSKIKLEKAYLLFYSNNGSVKQCNEILNLKGGTLSWMNNTNGKIFVFKKNQ
jgi:hypothetical protein